jgi:hypothetical protein
MDHLTFVTVVPRSDRVLLPHWSKSHIFPPFSEVWQVFLADAVKWNVTAERFVVILSAAKDLSRPACMPDSSLRSE